MVSGMGFIKQRGMTVYYGEIKENNNKIYGGY